MTDATSRSCSGCPLAVGPRRARSLPARRSARAGSPRSARSARSAIAIALHRRLRRRGRPACSTSPTTCGSRSSGIHYKLGVDGLNVFLIALTTLAVRGRACWPRTSASWDRPRLFFFHLVLAETAVLGAFMAQDLALFVVFFDLMLIPFYFLIGGWGSGRAACGRRPSS